jgi:hypothetical protein
VFISSTGNGSGVILGIYVVAGNPGFYQYVGPCIPPGGGEEGREPFQNDWDRSESISRLLPRLFCAGSWLAK